MPLGFHSPQTINCYIIPDQRVTYKQLVDDASFNTALEWGDTIDVWRKGSKVFIPSSGWGYGGNVGSIGGMAWPHLWRGSVEYNVASPAGVGF